MIIGIVGRMGSGKTLLMTYLSYKAFMSGQAIFSNYRLTYPHKIITKKDILSYAEKKSSLENCVLLIDECQIMLDCRNFQKNSMITFFLLQTRKRGVDLIYTTQQFFNVDKRLRENTDYIIECQPLKSKRKPGQDDKADRLKGIKFSISQYDGRNCFTLLKSGILPKPQDIYKLYNTYQIIDINQE